MPTLIEDIRQNTLNARKGITTLLPLPAVWFCSSLVRIHLMLARALQRVIEDIHIEQV